MIKYEKKLKKFQFFIILNAKEKKNIKTKTFYIEYILSLYLTYIIIFIYNFSIYPILNFVIFLNI